VSAASAGLPGGHAAKLLAFLAGGPCIARPLAANGGIVLERDGATSPIATAGLFAELAKTGWIVRSGQQVRLSDKAERLLSNLGCDDRNSQSPAGAPLRETEALMLDDGDGKRLVRRVKVECPVDFLAAKTGKNGKTWLSGEEHAAAERFRADHARAQMMPGVTMRWSIAPTAPRNGGPGGNAGQTDAAIAAKARFNAALDAAGPEFAGLLIDICCHLKGLETVEAERGWPRRSWRGTISRRNRNGKHCVIGVRRTTGPSFERLRA
jgi:hypothetical protein